MIKLKEVYWGEPLKAEPIKNGIFDEMFGAEMLELTWEDINNLVKGFTLYVVIEGEYALLIRLKG